MMTMREFITKADEQVCTVFNASGTLALMYVAIDDEGKDNVFLAPPLEDKDMALVLVRRYLAHIKATRVMSMMEAWVIDASNDEEKARRAMAYAETGESLEHAPDRAEAIVYVVEDAAEGALMAQRLITRDAGGKAKLGPLTFLPQEGIRVRRWTPAWSPPCGASQWRFTCVTWETAVATSPTSRSTTASM